MKKSKLYNYNKANFLHGKSYIVRFSWIIISSVFFYSIIPYPSIIKCYLLRLFGAKVGKGVVIKPGVKIKQPWRLEIGDYCWIGEDVWIDNLVRVKLFSNVCLSQGALLLTGNHNYKKSEFDLMTGEIQLEDGVWIGAKALVGPGVNCLTHSVLVSGSVTFTRLEPYSIYQGNPASYKRKRVIE